ncbi:MGMT family protein [Bacillus sp. HNG]|uniref:MGMT family protein n=1 Tax=Bacillus sp. HNG TaxID=2293325 RepID=UPI000E2F9221|nr:MGMT family protein [Bacillus sp. HNG]RFB18350.1 MGMT family protein [Bacillus sp. HNG]
MKPFTENVIRLIKQIPPGKVMTYGQIAKLAGSPRGARQVVRVLHSMSKKYNLPWFRVINSRGEITIRDEETHAAQMIFLEDEGIEVVNRSIDLTKYQYHPE